MTKEKQTLIKMANDLITTESIRLMTIDKLENDTPDYFWRVPASSTGKHHPVYALGDGGLARHTIGALKILHFMLMPNSMNMRFTREQRDCMYSAIILHDTRKLGSQTRYDNLKVTGEESKTMDYHELMVDIPTIVNGCYFRQSSFIKSLIHAHMGEWGAVNPSIECERMVHLADFLASRKDINVVMDNG